MSFGIARALFSSNITGAAIAGSPYIGYWQQSSIRGAGQQRSLRFTESSAQIPTTVNATVSLWFRGTISEYDEKFVLYSSETNPTSGSSFGVDIQRQNGESARIFAAFFSPGYGADSLVAAPAEFENLYLDNQWHHVFVQFRGESNDSSLSKIYIDGVDQTTRNCAGTYPGKTVIGPRHDFCGYKGAYQGNVNTETTIDMADIWVKYGNSTNYIPNLSWWYNNGKAVELGNDGTLSGAPAPDIFIHEAGTGYDISGEHLIQDGVSSLDGYIVNGGTMTGTLSHVGDNTGQITAYDTGGPPTKWISLFTAGYWSQTSLKQAGYQRNFRFQNDTTNPATYMYEYFPEYDNSAGRLNGIVTNNKIHDSTGPYFLGVTASLWFRGFPNDVMSNSILYAEGPSPSSNAGLDFSVQINTSGITSGANVSTFSANPNNFSDLYLDGKWHHIWIQWRGRANDVTKNKIYIDGVDKTTDPTAGTVPAGGEEMNNYGPIHHIGGAAGHGTSDMSVNSQHTLDMADLWVRYADETDYIPNKHWWYNNGYVNLGNDGTASGAPRPTLFIRIDTGDSDWGSNETNVIQSYYITAGSGNSNFIANGGYLTGGSFDDVGYYPPSPFETAGKAGQITIYKSGGPQFSS